MCIGVNVGKPQDIVPENKAAVAVLVPTVSTWLAVTGQTMQIVIKRGVAMNIQTFPWSGAGRFVIVTLRLLAAFPLRRRTGSKASPLPAADGTTKKDRNQEERRA